MNPSRENIIGLTGYEVADAFEPNPLDVDTSPTGRALADEQLGGKTYDQIYTLWKTEGVLTDSTVRQRAVSILTASQDHNIHELPYDAPDQYLSRLFYIEKDTNSGHALRDSLVDRPELSHELAQGALYWLNTSQERRLTQPDDSYGSHGDYQALIHQLLPIVDTEIGDELFQFFKIQDVKPFYNSDFASGYRPLESIMADKGVPFRYVMAAVGQWCRIAEREEHLGIEPRQTHERATSQMSEMLQLLTYSFEEDKERYDALVRIIEDTLSPDIAYVTDIREGSYIGISLVADTISDIDLRNRFLQRHGRAPISRPEPTQDIQTESSPEHGTITLASEGSATKLSLNVQSEYFNAIRDGQKTIEGRLAKTKYSDLRPGDTIAIADDASGEQLVMEITSLHIYAGFSQAFSKREDFQAAVPGVASADDASRVYEQFYSLDKQADQGVIFLEIQPLWSGRPSQDSPRHPKSV